MSKFTLTTILSLLVLMVVAQPNVRNEGHLKEIINYSKENSVFKDSVNWDSLEPEISALHEDSGLIVATKYLLKHLRDFHGRIWYEMIPYNGLIKEGTSSVLKFDSTLWEQYRYTAIPVQSQLINKEYGYLSIPGIAMGPDSLNAHDINNRVLDLARSADIKGWIIDLRLNGGGTMYPMLSGLNALLGNEALGSFIDRASEYKEQWTLKNGDIYVDTFQVSDYGITDLLDLSNQRVVVITSARTASSGEVVTLAFRNRPNTTIIGEPTSGYTTTVSWNQLDEKTVFQLTISWYADRMDNTFKGERIPPDVPFTGATNFEDPTKDEWVQKAIDILSE